jgi:hypothetical protein
MKRKMILLALASVGLTAMAQTDNQQQLPVLNETESTSKYIPVTQYWKEHNIFQHLDVSVSAGTTGIGIDVASPIGDYVQLRAGYDFMPRFTKNMKFDVMLGDQPARQYDSNGNRIETQFDRLAEMLYDYTGYEVEDHIDMEGTPTMNNFKLLVDVFPFKNNKHWHFTAGFYWGPSQFAEAVNTTEAMTSLLSLGMYNQMYAKTEGKDPDKDLVELARMPDPNDPDEPYVYYMTADMIRQFQSYGRMGFSLGEYAHDVYDKNGNLIHSAGDKYVMEPDDNGMVHVKAKSNAFKPYLGFGYGGRLLKNRDDWKVSFDAGVWFWGGTADLYVHDGTNLTKDVKNIKGQVGDYVDIFKAFKVYPCLSVRFTKTIF